MESYLSKVIRMLGDPGDRYRDPESWFRLEERWQLRFPRDYREFVDRYAPIQVNGHLYFSHPATTIWNLGTWIEETVEAYDSVSEWISFPIESFGSDGPKFGVSGLIPIFGSDRGENFFLKGDADADCRSICVYAGSDDDFYVYGMDFAEWLYRYLIGEDMAGPNSSAFYPGPVEMRHLPMTAEERTVPYCGPDRGM